MSAPTKKTLKFRDPVSGKTRAYAGMAEIAPGVWQGEIPAEDIPPVGFVSFKRLQDGTYLPVVRTFQNRLRLTPDIGQQLGVGMPGSPESRGLYMTIKRLVMGGFIAARQIAPGTIDIDLNSFWAHYQATQQPGYWTPERRSRYRRRTRGTTLPEDES